MLMVNPVSIALSGLNAASTRAAASATNVANATTEGYTPVDVVDVASEQGLVQSHVVPRDESEGGVDYAREIIDAKQAAAAYKANAAVIRVAHSMEDELLDSFDERA